MISVIVSISDQKKVDEFLYPSLFRTDKFLKDNNLPELDKVFCAGKENIAKNYNEANTRAKYKIRLYLHEDVELGDPSWLFKTLSVFAADDTVKLVGLVGTSKLQDKGMWWESGKEFLLGELFSGKEHADWPLNPLLVPTRAECCDGFFMCFSEPPTWDENLPGFHFYDMGQSRKIKKAGGKIMIIPHKAWHIGEIRTPIKDEEWKVYYDKWNIK